MNDAPGAWTTDVETGHKWLKAMNDAAAARNMTIQYSMSHTAAILHSSTLQAVTQIRASGDYECGSGQWRIGEVCMYYYALGAVGSKVGVCAGAFRCEPFSSVAGHTRPSPRPHAMLSIVMPVGEQSSPPDRTR